MNGRGGNIVFDIVIPTENGAIFAVRFVQDSEVHAASTDTGTRMNITNIYGLLGHANEDTVRQVATQLGWVITHGTLRPCLHCAQSKAKQKNVCQLSTSTKAKEPGGRVYLDLSKVAVAKKDGSEVELNKKHWKSIVDEMTRKKWCDFVQTKSGMVEPTCKWMNMMKKGGKPIKVIRIDPGGENVKLEKRVATTTW